MNDKSFAISIGSILILAALFTMVPNTLIGRYGYFRTDLLLNLVHFLSGVVLVLAALKFEYLVPKTLRIMGVLYLIIALIGAISTGFSDYGRSLGIMEVSGPDHLLHLVIGLLLIAVGTREIRSLERKVEHLEDTSHAELHS